MTVGEIAEVSRPSSLVWIEKDGVVLFTDWLYKIPEELKAETIKEFTFYPEIRHKDWKKRGFYSPMQPEVIADYRFSDLEMKLYYKMIIQ